MIRALLLAAQLLPAFFLTACQPTETAHRAEARTVVIGFDGMDPALLERWMDEGRLPHFSAMRAGGHYQRLGTTNPAQSPVAWASFATGHNPGEHAIFDFLRRAPGSYVIDFSIAEQKPPKHVLSMFGYRLPLDSGELVNRRLGEPFWVAAEQAGQRASVFRVPVTYPPDPVSRMISGMGVPDLLGSQGTYTILASRRLPGADNGGRVLLAPIDEDGVIRTALEGPAHPLKPSAPPLSIPLKLVAAADGATLTLDGQSHALKLQQWSPWMRVKYSMGIFGSVPGMLRAYLSEGFPRPLLYLSPIQVDPRDPALPIGSPAGFSNEMAEKIGDFHTLGMPEETWALNQGHLGEQAWLDMVKTTLAEGEAMLYDTLDRDDSELVIEVFVQTDRVSHMFWHGLDESHPLHAKSSGVARSAILWIYAEADRVLGEVQRRLGDNDRLVVLSDHGFASFRRAVNLNRWLAAHGYLAFKPGADPAQPLFAAVDWSKSRAYALGLNGVFINRQGREPSGIVASADVAALKQDLVNGLAALRDPVDDAQVVLATYDADRIYVGDHTRDAPDLVVGYERGYRASWQTSLGATPTTLIDDNIQHWSGDHCIDPSLVPGVLLTSFPLTSGPNSIQDIAALVKAKSANPAKVQ